MEVLLIERIKKLGNAGDIVKVRPGFARNFLFPNHVAVRPTEANLKAFEAKRVEIEKRYNEQKSTAEALLKLLDNLTIEITQEASEEGKLYGSVTENDIANVISAKINQSFDPKYIVLKSKIKEVGEYKIDIDLDYDVVGSINLIVAIKPNEKS